MTTIPNEKGMLAGGQIIGMVERRDKVNYYLDIAEAVAQNSTCLCFKWGAVIVSDDEVISTGYTGAPRGRQNCIDVGICYKDKENLSGECKQGVCRSVHAEANAIISASRRMMKGSSLYLTGYDICNQTYIENPHCCSSCKMLMINAGIRDVYIRIDHDKYIRETILDWVKHDDSLTDEASY